MVTELSQERANALHFELMQGVVLRPGKYWDTFTPPSGWEQIGIRTVMFKIKVVDTELGLFAKMYAPAVANYARAMYEALKEAAELRTTPLILGPIAIAHTTLFFSKGEPIGKIPFYEFFKEIDAIAAIQRVAEKHKLRIARNVDLVEFLDLNAVYVVDVFDDANPWK